MTRRQQLAIVVYLLSSKWGLPDARRRAIRVLQRLNVAEVDWCTCKLDSYGREKWKTLTARRQQRMPYIRSIRA
jgi:hypothetical protein